MKRSTAVRHLAEMAELATDRMTLRDSDIGWPLEEIWVTGDLLGTAGTLDHTGVVLALDLPADQLPWLALHPAAEWIGRELNLGKRPSRWFYRPRTWPIWNHANRRLVRFWSAADGPDLQVLEALRTRRFDGLLVTEPSTDLLVEQLRKELQVSRDHLRTILER